MEPERRTMTRRLHDCWWGVGVRKVAQILRSRPTCGHGPTYTMIMVEATDGTGHVGRETVMVEVTQR